MGGARATTILLHRQRSAELDAPSTILRSLRELRMVPLPRFAVADEAPSLSRGAHWRASVANSDVERPVIVARIERSEIRERSTKLQCRSRVSRSLSSSGASRRPSVQSELPRMKKGSGTPANAGQNRPRTQTARGSRHGESGLRRPFRSRARSPAGVPPRLCPRGVSSLGDDPGQASWDKPSRGGGHSADGLPTSSDAPRTPVVMPAGMMPGPPGSGADEAPPAGTALAPAARHHPDGVP